MRIWLAVALLLGACGDDDGLDYTGTPGTPVASDFSDLVPIVSISVDGTEYPFIVDTGAPFTILSSNSFPAFTDGKRDVDLGVYGVGVEDYQVLVFPAFGDTSVGGLLGGDFLRHFALTLDYQNEQSWLSDPFDPAAPIPSVDAEAPVSVPISIEGGGRALVPGNCPGGCGTVDVAQTRILTQARFEAYPDPVWILIDTGASAVVLDQQFHDTLENASPGRPILGGIEVDTVDGLVPAFLSRVWRLDLIGLDDGDANVALDDVSVLVLPGTDLLASLSFEVDRQVVALVGGTYMRHFLTTLDYQTDHVHLGRYRTSSHIPADEFVQVGFQVAQVGADWVVSIVYPGTDAAADGIVDGDVLEEIGMAPITGTSPAYVASLMDDYALGQDMPVGLRRPPSDTIEQKLVRVEDLLPSFPPP